MVQYTEHIIEHSNVAIHEQSVVTMSRVTKWT